MRIYLDEYESGFETDDEGREYVGLDLLDGDYLEDVARDVNNLFRRSPFYKLKVQAAFAQFGIFLEEAKVD